MSRETPARHLARLKVQHPSWSIRHVSEGYGFTAHRESAARAVQSGRAAGTPKSRDAQVEMIRVLRVARRGAMKARIQGGAQIDAIITSAPEQVRGQLRCLKRYIAREIFPCLLSSRPTSVGGHRR